MTVHEVMNFHPVIKHTPLLVLVAHHREHTEGGSAHAVTSWARAWGEMYNEHRTCSSEF